MTVKNFYISENAALKIIETQQKKKHILALNISVDGGGCNGAKYSMEFVSNIPQGHKTFTSASATVVMDDLSLNFLENSTLNYKQELGQSGFFIENLNSKSRCGCGQSFSPN